jgi:hypothetical protein
MTAMRVQVFFDRVAEGQQKLKVEEVVSAGYDLRPAPAAAQRLRRRA